MKIKAIRLQEVGPFQGGIAIEGLSGGLDVLSAPNEFGKSTIFRALRTLFFEKHSSAKKEIGRLKPYKGGSPLIEADFEFGGRAWRVRKQFGKPRSASLISLDGRDQVYRGAEADDRLEAILTPRGSTPERFKLLWVEQKKGLEKLAAKDIPRSALLDVIENEIQSVTGGQLADQVRIAVGDELEALVTSRGGARTNGPYDHALKRRADVRGQLEAAEAKASSLNGWIHKRDEIFRALSALPSQQDRAARQIALDEARRKYAGEEKKRQQIKTLKAELDVAVGRQSAAETSLKNFDRQLEEYAGLGGQIARASMQVEDCRAEERRARVMLGDHEQAGVALGEKEKQLNDLGLMRAQRDKNLLARETFDAASDRLRRAHKVLETIKLEQEALNGCRVTSEGVTALDQFEHSLNIARGQLEAASPTVSIAYEKGGEGRIRVNDVVATDQEELSVTEPLVLVIAGVGEIRIAPGGGVDRSAQEAEVRRLTDEMSSLLDDLNAVSLDEARGKLIERQKLEASVGELNATLKALVPAGVKALETEVSELRDAYDIDQIDGELPTSETIAADLKEVRQQLEKKRQHHVKLTSEHVRAVEVLSKLQENFDEMSRRKTVLEDTLGPEASRSLERARLAEVAERAGVEARRVTLTYQANLEDVLSDEACTALKADIAHLEDDLRAEEQTAVRLREELAHLEGQIKTADEDGVVARVEQLSGELELAEKGVARCEENLAALALLQEMLEDVKKQRHHDLVRPVLQRVSLYAKLVFPDAQLGLDSDFAIERLQRAHHDETIDLLSDGTQEQLGILARLAFARLLAEAGSGGPLLLDDPLVFSDETRLSKMFDALRVASQSHQVFVLTCREDAFAKLGGTRLQVESWSAERRTAA